MGSLYLLPNNKKGNNNNNSRNVCISITPWNLNFRGGAESLILFVL